MSAPLYKELVVNADITQIGVYVDGGPRCRELTAAKCEPYEIPISAMARYQPGNGGVGLQVCCDLRGSAPAGPP
jgi:hypothetical protein